MSEQREERRARYLQIVAEVHDEWAATQAANRFEPGEHPASSDYNVETLIIEATGEQLDERAQLLRQRLDAEGLYEYPLT